MTGSDPPLNDPLLEAIAELRAIVINGFSGCEGSADGRPAKAGAQRPAHPSEPAASHRGPADLLRERVEGPQVGVGDAQSRLDNLARRLSDKLSRRAAADAAGDAQPARAGLEASGAARDGSGG